jgi:hypothetical protein
VWPFYVVYGNINSVISRTQTIGLMMLALASLSVLTVASTVQQASAADQRAKCNVEDNVIGACVQAQVSGLCVGVLTTRQECPSD